MQTGSNLRDQVALVVGGTGGIGAATVQTFQKEGARVVSAALDERDQIRGDRIWGRHLDIRDENSVLKLFAWLDEEFGRVDVLVQAAGVGIFKPIVELSLDDWRKVIDTNLTGAFLCSREALKRMKRQGGRIIHIGSIADHRALPEHGAYGTSKFGVRGLTQIINEEARTCGVQATLLCLGAVHTPIWKDRVGFDPRDMLSPDEVAEALLAIATAAPGSQTDEVRLFPPKGLL